MDDILRAEDRYRAHHQRIATADRDAWKQPEPMARAYPRRGLRAALAKALIALASRLAPPASVNQATSNT